MLILVNIKKTKFIIFLSEKTGNFLNRKRIITLLLLVILIHTISISCINYFNFTNKSTDSQKDKLPLKTANEFEYYEKNGTIDDTKSIQIELPDLTWNITEIELEFTNISQYRQLRTIEENISVSLLKDFYYFGQNDWADGLGQQINFSEPTNVYGIFLYGFKSFAATEIVNITLMGFDDVTYFPNTTVYHTQLINMSTTFGWYFQDFSSSPLTFYRDEYYIIIDGIEVYGQHPNYYFGYNKFSPTYPYLWEWERKSSGSWPDGEDILQGEPLLCKILQKVNKTYFPKEIEMQAKIDESYYDISNRTQVGEGNLSLTLLNFKPTNINFNIPIATNESGLQLNYNVSYNIQLRKPVSVIFIERGGGGNGDVSKVSTGIDPEFFFWTIIAIILSFIAALFSYQKVRLIKRNKRRYREKIFNKYMDVLNLNYVMVSDKLSGLNIYEQMISGKEMNPTLLSGFLQAISSFGLELTGSEDQSQTIRLEYQKSKILMSDFKNYRLINVFEENPSKEFMDSIEPLSQDIDKYFGKLLKNFDGETTRFAGIKELLERHLQISLVYPLKVVITDNTKLKSEEKSLVYQAINFMKKKNSDYFYISYLMSEGDFNPKRAEKILGLIERKIFQPVL